MPVVWVIASDILAGIESGCAQANFLWAYATLGECVGASCVAALATRALTLLPHFSAQGLSNTAWALASMDILEPVSSLTNLCCPSCGAYTLQRVHE